MLFFLIIFSFRMLKEQVEKNKQGDLLYKVLEKYHQNGTLKCSIGFSKEGLRESYEEHYENGTLYTKHSYSQGKLHGVCVKYTKDGTLRWKDRFYRGTIRTEEYYDRKGELGTKIYFLKIK